MHAESRSLTPIETRTLKRILVATAQTLVRIEVSPMLYVVLLGPSPLGIPLEVDSKLSDDETRLTFNRPAGRTLVLRWRPIQLLPRDPGQASPHL